MNRSLLVNQIKSKQNFLCIGLDPDLTKIPVHILNEDKPVVAFCKGIIDATSDLAIAYKPNLAFFESLGPKGWTYLEEVMAYIPKHCFTIADAKRGDIGNTSAMYAKCFFEYFDFDAVTVAPYMGRDSIEPFLGYKDKWVIVLGLTSNSGSKDFEMLPVGDQYLFERVIEKVASWTTPDNTMFVIGATQPEYFTRVRSIIPDHFLLIPGVGAQGGSLAEVCQHCVNGDIGILVNNGREILYASSGEDYADAARNVALKNIHEMQQLVSWVDHDVWK